MTRRENPITGIGLRLLYNLSPAAPLASRLARWTSLRTRTEGRILPAGPEVRVVADAVKFRPRRDCVDGELAGGGGLERAVFETTVTILARRRIVQLNLVSSAMISSSG